jgi:hypothetical protein
VTDRAPERQRENRVDHDRADRTRALDDGEGSVSYPELTDSLVTRVAPANSPQIAEEVMGTISIVAPV